MENRLGPIRKTLGAEEYTKDYCTSPKKETFVLEKWVLVVRKGNKMYADGGGVNKAEN